MGIRCIDYDLIIWFLVGKLINWMLDFNYREEIQRIKANKPDISHREAFSTAAKNVSSTSS